MESEYEYTSGISGTRTECTADEKTPTNIGVEKWEAVTPNNKEQMKAALEQQPLAVAIEADKMVFQTYKSGILDDESCGYNLDHAVLVVGWGTENGVDYWTVKNSWNTTWGDSGYIKLAMDDGRGTCGVQMEPLVVTAK